MDHFITTTKVAKTGLGRISCRNGWCGAATTIILIDAVQIVSDELKQGILHVSGRMALISLSQLHDQLGCHVEEREGAHNGLLL